MDEKTCRYLIICCRKKYLQISKGILKKLRRHLKKQKKKQRNDTVLLNYSLMDWPSIHSVATVELIK